jgi:hypothetical protein
MSSDLDEVGKQRELGTVAWSTPMEGHHQEEQGQQGGHRGLVAGHAPWPGRRVEEMAIACG